MTKDFLKVSALDTQDLESSVERNAPLMHHAWRQEQYIGMLDRLAQPFAAIAEEVEKLDHNKGVDGSDAYRGALLALTAIVEVLNNDSSDTDMTGEAAAVHLAGLTPSQLAADFKGATSFEQSAAKESGADVNDLIQKRLREQYPALAGLIEKIIDAPDGRESSFEKGIRYGAFQMLLAIDSTVVISAKSDEEDLSDTRSAPPSPSSLD